MLPIAEAGKVFEPGCRVTWQGVGERIEYEGEYRVDWQPFDYATAEYALPLGGTGRLTLSLTPIPSGTRVSVRAAPPHGPGLRGLPRRVLSHWNKRRVESAWRARLLSLHALVTADQAVPGPAAPNLDLAASLAEATAGVPQA